MVMCFPERSLPARHCISHQRQRKDKTCHQLYQELYHWVHASSYLRAHTYQKEQIKLSPEGGTAMKCLKTAAAFIIPLTVFYYYARMN